MSIMQTEFPCFSAPDADRVRSKFFADLMRRYTINPPGLHEARDYTLSYRFRHSPAMRRVLGVWRWRGLYDAREELLPLLENATRILDHGGGACGLGFGADVVDSDVELSAAVGRYDVIFSSHTLEHCQDPYWVGLYVLSLLRPGGTFILHVPAYTAPHWNAGQVRKNDAAHGSHRWNFCLDEDSEACPKPCFALDSTCSRYVGDNSILMIRRFQ